VIVTVVGARPNFMKAAPIHRAFEQAGIGHGVVHTGQHYDDAMSKVFFDELGLPGPIADLGVGSGSHAEQTAAVMVGLERFFMANPVEAVLVVGDVNSTMAAAIVAAKLGIYCAHVEAGLRSGDWSMPEEINRAVTDAVVDLLLTPSPDADRNLLAEGCPRDSIARVGNVMIDTLLTLLPRARALAVPTRFGLVTGRYAVLTLHRPANVDRDGTLAGLLDAVAAIAARLPVVFPVHPRTRARLRDAGVGARLENTPGLLACEPLGYLEFLSLTSSARLILTDSGGLQEESTALGISCLTLRDNTERPITVAEGTNLVVGTDPARIVAAADAALSGRPRAARIPDLWDGRAALRVVAEVGRRLGLGPAAPRPSQARPETPNPGIIAAGRAAR
jgi:UDP-N-acetylglucosamine 2-epimerase (non-hydrolysing)